MIVPVRFRLLTRALGILFLLGAFPVLAGCGGRAVGSVSGVVKYRGQPLTSGTVNFYAPEKGRGASAPLDSSGAFQFPEALDVGSYKVYIQPPVPQQLPPGTKIKKTKLDIPKKYQDANGTPLAKEVQSGKNDFPIELTD